MCIIFGAQSVVAIAGPLIVYFCTKRYDRHQQQPLHREQNEADNDGRRHGRNDDFDDCRDNVVPITLSTRRKKTTKLTFTTNSVPLLTRERQLQMIIIISQRS